MGKSHIIQAQGQKACILGYRVLYRTSALLITDLTASLAGKTLPGKLRRYARPDLLIIDEFSCGRIEREESLQSAHLLCKIIALRNQKSSGALAANVDFEKWVEYLPDGPVTMDFLDRIWEGAFVHSSSTFKADRIVHTVPKKEGIQRRKTAPRHSAGAFLNCHYGA